MNYTVLDYLEKTAEKSPHKIAVIDRNTNITYLEVKNRASILAGEIVKKGIFKNKGIVVYLPKSVNSIVSFMGILYSGNFYSPIDIKQPTNRVKSIIKSLNPVIYITDNKSLNDLLDCGISESLIVNIDEIDFSRNVDEVHTNIIDTDIVYTLFTSGSTGTPKGVTITNRNVINYIEWAAPMFNITKNTIIGNQSPLHFDISTHEIYSSFKVGATLVLIPEEYFAFPARLLQYINEMNINYLYWVPSAFINVANFKLLEKTPLPAIETMMFGGEVMPVKHLNYWIKNLHNLELIANVYGPTEATVNCTYYILDRDFENHEVLPLGYPVGNTDLMVVDENGVLITESNVNGELYIRGNSLSVGYWNNPEKTKEAFIQNPFVKEYDQKVYRTGDLVYYNGDGLLVFSGRKDYQIKHQGYRIELGEIEAAAISIKDVENCCVIYADVHKQIVLFYTGVDDEVYILRELSKLIPKYMIPNKILLMEELPLNVNGKIDRLALKKEISN